MITSERELQIELVTHLTEQGFTCREYVSNSVGIADIVIDNAVIELKHLPDRDALYKAVGQAVLYRGAINKNLDAKIICSYYDELSLLRLQSAGVVLKQFGLELIPWMPGDELVFQTDSIYAKSENNFEIGDVCLVSSLCQKELIKYNSCWTVITESFDSLSKICLIGTEFVLPIQHLKKLEIGQQDKEDIKAISDRIAALQKSDLDDADDQFLELLQCRTVWTNRQLLLLQRMEEDYANCA